MTPLEIVLEFTRAEHACDPFALPSTEQTYLLRYKGGRFGRTAFSWGPDVINDLDRIRRPMPDREAMQRLGDKLSGFLTTAGWAAHEEAILEARKQNRPVWIAIRSAAAELYGLPWELITLAANGQHIGELRGSLFHYEWPEVKSAPRSPASPVDPGRIVFAWSAEGGDVPAGLHMKAIRDAYDAAGGPSGKPSLTIVPHASLKSLREALGKPPNDPASAGGSGGQRGAGADPLERPVRVLHILCHGIERNPGGDYASLVFCPSTPGDEPDVVDAGALRELLAPYAGSLRLVVVSACYSGRTGELGSHLGSIVQSIHRVGVPAVIGSRYPLSFGGAITLAEVLYKGLLAEHSPIAEAFLSVREALKKRAEWIDWASLQLYARASDGSALRPFDVRPYRGLQAFRPADHPFFFGRDEDVERLAGRLRAGERLLTVTGASGSGKSSLVMAGLVPYLRSGRLSGGAWEVRILRPGASPLKSLAAAIERTFDGSDGSQCAASAPVSAELEDDLRKRPEALAEAASRASVRSPRGRFLLVVDQFEEVFTAPADEAEAAAFIDCLLHAASVDGGPVHVVLTIRADFLGHCFNRRWRGLAERVSSSLEGVTPMNERGLRSAILEPAKLVGLCVDEAVVDSLCNELREASPDKRALHAGKDFLCSDELPLLSFALDELWCSRKDGRITWEAWSAMGGMRGLIARRADDVLASFTAGDEWALSFKLFARLIRVEEGAVAMAQQASRADLTAIAPGRIEAVLDRWIASRLLSSDKTVVRVAHEALIREWGTLRRWIGEQRDALSLLGELGHIARRWKQRSESPDELWRGARLARALELQGVHHLPISELEALFLAASESAERAAREKEEERIRTKHDGDPLVTIGWRTVCLPLFTLIPVGVAWVMNRAGLFEPTNAVAAAAFLAGIGALGIVLFFGRRWFWANRANRVFWLAVMIVCVGAAGIHCIAELRQIDIWSAVLIDNMFIASTGVMFALTVHRQFWVTSAPMAATVIAGLFIWPDDVFLLTLVGLAIGYLANFALVYPALRRPRSGK